MGGRVGAWAGADPVKTEEETHPIASFHRHQSR